MALKDYATGTVATAPSPADSGTSLTLKTGEGARMPVPPFYVTAQPPSGFPTLDNAEKLKVTGVSGDTLTITRAQGDTTAKSIEVGWRVSAAVFADDIPETTADLPDSTDHRYVTDNDLSKLANTSGTNTGDQDLSGLVPKTTTVNGHALSSSVTVTKSDVGLGSVTNDTQLRADQLDTDDTLTANSDDNVASQKATKTYVDDNARIKWRQANSTTQQADVNTGYIAGNSALVTITLPTTAAVGDVIGIQGGGSGGWKIAQNSGQTIHFGNADTTTGTTGSLASTNQYDGLDLVCITANTDWAVRPRQGNIEVV